MSPNDYVPPKTKIVEYWVDLDPHWHERINRKCELVKPYLSQDEPLAWCKPQGGLRLRVLVELPIIGDTGTDWTVKAITSPEAKEAQP